MALKNDWATGNTVTAGDMNGVANEILGINARGVYASLPTVGHPGRTYFCTDNGNTYYDNGTTWDLISVAGTGISGVEPPSASWTTTTLGSATFAADKGGRLLTDPSVSGWNLRAEYRTLTPTSNYTFTTYLDLAAFGANTSIAGMVLRSSAGATITFGPSFDTATSAAGFTLRTTKWTNDGTPSANYVVQTQGQLTGAGIPPWLRIRDDGTNRFFEYSYDGVTWAPHASHGRTDFLTPTLIGWGEGNNASGSTHNMRLWSWSVV